MTGSRRERGMLAGAAAATTRAVGPDAQMPRKDRAAAVSIVSNALLIVLKLAAGAITGSIAIITEAVHSSIDLIASIVAFFSVRKADEPADEDHPYGHQKVENLAAAIEGMLILVGAGIIVFESVRRLVAGRRGRVARRRHRRDRLLGAWPTSWCPAYLYRRARATDSPALEGDAAHLRTDAFTSTGVLVGLVLVEVTGVEAFDADHGAAGGRRDRVRGAADPHPLVARAGGRGASRPRSSTPCGRRSRSTARAEVVGFHKLRARRAGSRRYVDLHVQFREGTTLQRRTRGQPRAAGRDPRAPARRRRADPPRAGGARRARPPVSVRLTAAAAPTASSTSE